MALLLIFLLGLCVGSFLNVVILRLHEDTSPFKGRSVCPQCKRTLRWYELVPILSFALQKGTCTSCHKKISWQYPLIELSTALLFAIFSVSSSSAQGGSASGGQFSVLSLTTYFFLCILIVTFVTDLRWNLIYDVVLWPGILIALLIPLFSTTYSSTFLAALIGGGVFALQYILSQGRWVGSGDILLGAFLGLILGFPTILAALFYTYISGSLVALVLMSMGRKTTKDTLPLGCFMCAVGLLLLLLR